MDNLEYNIPCWHELDSYFKNVRQDMIKVNEMLSSNIILFGAGFHGQMVYQYLKKNGITIQAFCDNDESKCGKDIDGVPVILPENIKNNNVDLIFITAQHAVKPIKEQLNEMSFFNVSFDAFYAYKNRSEFENLFNKLFLENKSRRVIIELLKTMLTGNKTYCASVAVDRQFFALPYFFNQGNEVYVDAGAYVGDTVERFIWENNGAFKKIYAFEPGVFQFSALNKRVDRIIDEWAIERKKIDCIRAGLSNVDAEREIFSPPGALIGTSFISFDISSKEKARLYSLDSFLKREPVSFIKVDIEGLEMELLEGAKETISDHQPKIAISIYHKPDDIFNVSNLLKDLVPEYKFAIRQHAPSLMDTILYCWIED